MEPHYTNMCYPKCGELNAHMNMKNLAQGWKLGYPSKPQPLICPRQSDRRPPIHRASYPGEFAVRVDEDIEKQFLESFLTGQQADYLSQNPTTSVCLWFCSCKIARPEISGHFEAGKGPFEDIPPCSHVTMKWKLRIILRRGVVCLPDHPSNISWWLYQEKYFHMAIGYSSTWLFCNNKKLSLENFPTSLSKNHQFLGILDLGHQVTTSLFGSIVSGPAKASVPLLPNSAPEVQKRWTASLTEVQNVDSPKSLENFNYQIYQDFRDRWLSNDVHPWLSMVVSHLEGPQQSATPVVNVGIQLSPGVAFITSMTLRS